MARELTYALITPYSLLKSRTGGVIGRLLSLCQLDLVAARMYAPSDQFVESFADSVMEEPLAPETNHLVAQYVRDAFRKNNRFGISNRLMLLVFEGEDAVRHLHEDVVGPISPDVKGDTVRGTYGDYVVSQAGNIEFFEPAVLTPASVEVAKKQLQLLSDCAKSDGGLLTERLTYPEGTNVETTLVMIKPDNFWRRSPVPGNIIDCFSRTGLYIVGAKVLRMTVKQAEEFYKPVRDVFVDKLRPILEDKTRGILEGKLEFPVPEEVLQQFVDGLRESYAEHEFRKIVNYMAGEDSMVDTDDMMGQRKGMCLALIYQGVDAISKIRGRLGATNPLKAEEGTVRSTYGHDLMKNGAHASDSCDNAARERKIIGLWEEEDLSDFELIINEYLNRG